MSIATALSHGGIGLDRAWLPGHNMALSPCLCQAGFAASRRCRKGRASWPDGKAYAGRLNHLFCGGGCVTAWSISWQ